MSTCCAKPPREPTTGALLKIALAGNPNSGKTTIFNALTGMRQHVGNYPGVTVEKKTGRCRLSNGWADVIDLPGTYSLISRSPDELVAMEVLRGLRSDTPPPDVVVAVVDASNLQRNLYLLSQLVELGRPMVIALNMMDIAARHGVYASPEALEREIGVPVAPIVGHRREGIDELKTAIERARVAPMPQWQLPQAMQEEITVVGGGLGILLAHPEGISRSPLPESRHRADPRTPERYRAIAERLIVGDRAADLSDIAAHEPVASLLNSAMNRMQALGIDPMQADIEAHYRWIETVTRRSEANVDELAAMGTPAPDVLAQQPAISPGRSRNWTERIDSIFVHKFWGLIVFAAIMGSLFVALFWAAKPIMEAMGEAVKWLGGVSTSRLPEGPIKALLNDGIFAGVGAVIVFIPQIALLFMFLAILEDSGYLARAAFLMDRLLSKVGLHGKSFIPLLSSFACAIPGILATRTIDDRKDRLATILVAPFMSCSARLPVYTLLIGTFFASSGALAQAGIMLGLYVTGIAAAAGTAWVFKRSLLKGRPAAFIMEMPTYKLPQASQVGRHVWVNTKEFIVRAGTTIFCLSVLLWVLAYYPRLPAGDVGKYATHSQLDAAQVGHSFAGKLGRAMEPVIRPLGYDWKMGVGLVGAFAAREVFVSTLGIIYSVGEGNDHVTDLSAAMRADRVNGHAVWSPLVAISLLVWFVLAFQCMSTFVVVRRETRSWRWPIFMLIYMNTLAYVVSLAVFQVGSWILRA